MDVNTKIANDCAMYRRWASRGRVGTYDIPAANLPRFMVKLDKLNRKAARLGYGPITAKELGVWHRRYTDEITGIKRAIAYVRVVVTGDTPMIGGWRFVATLQHLDGVNMVRTIPGVELPEAYRTAEPACDHCQLDRQRKDTYVIYNASTDTYKQVGRSCLGDFTGSNNPHSAARYAEWLAQIAEMADDESDPMDRRAAREVPTDVFVAHVAALIDRYGWTSRGAAQYDPAKIATADRAWAWIDGDQAFDKEPKPTDADRDTAVAALDWVAGIDPLSANDYLWNLYAACDQDWLNYRTAGIVASVIGAHRRAVEAADTRGNAVDLSGSDWRGAIKGREVWTLTLIAEIPTEGFYGLTVIHKFVDDSGNLFVWFSSGWPKAEMAVWQTYRIKGTVKAHDTYNGIKQTVLTRCANVDVTDGVADPVA